MKEQSDQDEGKVPSSSEEKEEPGKPSRMSRVRRAFGFLRSPYFWGGLVVGTVALGAGVLIGLGMDRLGDDREGSDDYERRERTFLASQRDFHRDGFEEKEFGSDRRRFRFHRFSRQVPDGWEKEWPEKENRIKPGPFSEERDFDIPYGALVLEGLIDEIGDEVERIVDQLMDYLRERDFDSAADRPFGPGDFWNEEGGSSEGFDFPFGELLPGLGLEEGFLNEGFGLPLAELLPGFGFELPEDCQLDFQNLEGIMEDLPDLEGDDVEPDEFFETLNEFFREVCETPSDQGDLPFGKDDDDRDDDDGLEGDDDRDDDEGLEGDDDDDGSEGDE